MAAKEDVAPIDVLLGTLDEWSSKWQNFMEKASEMETFKAKTVSDWEKLKQTYLTQAKRLSVALLMNSNKELLEESKTAKTPLGDDIGKLKPSDVDRLQKDKLAETNVAIKFAMAKQQENNVKDNDPTSISYIPLLCELALSNTCWFA